ncbi:hypothetical protein F183_A06070 [Bryobacterales bacterium F-183]|nr:hypothetical protein F183_A06070 [Bryobacterales bacterium F-183]
MNPKNKNNDPIVKTEVAAGIEEVTPTRRQALLGFTGATAAFAVAGAAIATAPVMTAQNLACVLSSQMTEGPYWVDERLNRSDIRTDPTNGTTKTGLPLTVTLNIYSVTSAGCAALQGAWVDIWHCDAGGLYSDASANNTVGQKFLRGYQVTNSSGTANFTTIYPGWYSGRAVHIHVRIRTFNGTTVVGNFTTQLFFDDAISDTVFTQSPYNTRGRTRDTLNSNDMVYNGAANKERALATLVRTDSGYSATLNIGVNIATQTPVVATTGYALPQIAFGGGWNTSLYLANTNADSTSVTLNFLNTAGSPLTVTLPGQGSSANHTIALAGRATAIVELANSGDLTQGWVEALLPDGVTGYGVFRQTATGRADQEAVVPLSIETATVAQMVYDDVNFTTGLAVVNPSTASASINVIAYNASGSQVGSTTITLAARARTAVTLRDLSGMAGVAGTRGWLSFTTTAGTVSVLGLRFGSAAFTSIPAVHK